MFIDENGQQEQGIDGGGLSRELMTLLQRQLLSPTTGLFRATEKGELYPAYTDLSEALQRRYRFVGQVLGRLLLTEQLYEAPFAPFFLNLLLRSPWRLSDVRYRSEEMYRSLLYLRSRATDEELAEYTMSIQYRNGDDDEMKTYLFQENGDKVSVRRDTVQLYTQYVAQFYLCDSILQATSCIQVGMRDVLSSIDFSLFDAVGVLSGA